MIRPRMRLGAYVLPGDPTWLRSSLSSYYHLLDDLVVPIPEDGRSWTGATLPVRDCLTAINRVDTRRLMRHISGRWIDRRQPLQAEIAQRQACVNALNGVDWVLQVDNDEILPDASALLEQLQAADDAKIPAVEWPMRVLFRRLKDGRFLEVVAADGGPRFEYPGPIAVKCDQQLVDCRRTAGRYLRPVVVGDDRSLQIVREVHANEVRRQSLRPDQAILHNSWGRSAPAIRRKMRSTAHQEGLRMQWYYWIKWWPAPLIWRQLRNFHLFDGPLWPRLGVLDPSMIDLLVKDDLVE